MKPKLLLTKKEKALLDRIGEGMDSPGSGWLHEIGDGSHSEAAVLGHLIAKGLVTSTLSPGPDMACARDCWEVEVTAAGAALTGLKPAFTSFDKEGRSKTYGWVKITA